MVKTCSFFGHRKIMDYDGIYKILYNKIECLIKSGYSKFLIGNHGDFDFIALKVCRILKLKYDIEIEQVVSNLSFLNNSSNIVNYDDVYIKSYFIEEEYFKNKIIKTNKYIVDDSDIIVCYVDFNRKVSGAKKTINYAIKNNKTIINLYNK